MSIDLVLALVGAAFSLGVLGVLIWAFTRPRDRIQLATVCLFFCALGYFGAATAFLGQGPSAMPLTLLAGLMAALLYITTGALAIFHQRWAWRAAVAAFSVQLVLGLVFPFTSAAKGVAGVAGGVVWVLVGTVGLWACLHAGSRQWVFGAADHFRPH